MPSLTKLLAVPRFDRRPRRSSVPVKRCVAPAHNGSGEPALQMRRERGQSDQRAARALPFGVANPTARLRRTGWQFNCCRSETPWTS